MFRNDHVKSDCNRILYGYAAEGKISENLWSSRKYSVFESPDLFSAPYFGNCGLYRVSSGCPYDSCGNSSDRVYYYDL